MNECLWGIMVVGGYLGLPQVGEDHGPGGDEVAIVDVILGQTVGDTLSDNS
jgi:hypothetical protein